MIRIPSCIRGISEKVSVNKIIVNKIPRIASAPIVHRRKIWLKLAANLYIFSFSYTPQENALTLG